MPNGRYETILLLSGRSTRKKADVRTTRTEKTNQLAQELIAPLVFIVLWTEGCLHDAVPQSRHLLTDRPLLRFLRAFKRRGHFLRIA